MATVNEVLNTLAAQIADLQARLVSLTPPAPTVYAPVTQTGTPTSTRLCTNLPTYDGDMNELFAWIKRSREVMTLFHGTPLACEALTIIRTKIVGKANKTLDNANVPLNYDAIARKLIEAYSDKRPIDLLQGILIRTKQNDLSIQTYYDLLCEKMNEIFYKVELENEGRNDFITGMKTMVENQAKDTFLTWVNPKIRYLLQARNPSSLQEARDIAIVLETKSLWRQELEDGHGKNQQSKKTPVNSDQKKQINVEKKPFNTNQYTPYYGKPNFHTQGNYRPDFQTQGNPKPFVQAAVHPKPMIPQNEPMDVDKSTMQQNQRSRGGTYQQRRFFNANVLEGDDNDPEGLLEEIPETIIQETDFLV